ncbi:MAG: response regulator [Synergistaceae bacterium]|jgi:signal transduction histidine kinase/DNA-binding response OmpR family regulator/HPt (histidine-containing phosphotransfer) domain-containing protein|nr:response regulator [Synergistaceae bacterium]
MTDGPVVAAAGAAPMMESLIYENKRLSETVRKLEARVKEQDEEINCFGVISGARDRLAGMMNAEQAKREKYLEMMLGTVRDLVIMCDRDECIAYCSDSFLKAAKIVNFGLVNGKPFAEVMAVFCDEGFIKRSINRLSVIKMQKRTIGDVVEVIDYGQGERRFYVIQESPMFDENGVFDGFLMVYHDMTELFAAKEAAEAANRSKSAFLATMSHEIRTPLNAIIGLSEIELQKRLLPDAYSNLEKIYNAGSILLGIINDVLDISKIEVGNFELTETDYNIVNIINDAVQLNIVRIGEKELSFEMKADETLPSELWGDELRVKQILNNLLSNAFKYTNKGKITLRVGWMRFGADAMLKFVVSDTGIGIRKKDIPRLFSEYSQLDSGSSRSIQGTGLGLSIAKNLATLMGGSIDVESEYGVGSTFTVKILQRIKDHSPIGREAAASLENLDFIGNGGKRVRQINRAFMPYGRVLVVDDVITNLDVARGLMISYGLSIDCVSGGREAVERVRAVGEGGADVPKYDVIFMDHMMPEMDGIEATRIIRSEIGTEYARSVPIIALTANALVGNEEMFIENGFNGFIPKPMDIQRLDMALNRFIRDRQSDETLRKAEREAAGMRGEPARGKLSGASIEGLDLASGIGIYDDEAAYIGVLRSFASHTPALLENMRAPSAENLHEYMINIHGIKGACRGISAYALASMAEELESAAKRGDLDGVRRGNLFMLETAEKLIAGIGKLVGSLAGSGGDKIKSPEPDESLLASMLEASRHYDTLAMESAMAELEMYEYERGGELVADIRALLENLEYDELGGRLETAIGDKSTII